MMIWDKISEFIHFLKEAGILRRINADSEYFENSFNGEIVEQNIFIDGESVKTSLEAKRKYIEAYAQKERLIREKAVKKANQKRKPLTVEAVKILRDAEDKKRFNALKHIKEMPGR